MALALASLCAAAPQRSELTPHTAHYRDRAGLEGLLAAWLRERPEAARALTFAGAGGEGVPLGLEVFRPGGRAPEERTAVLIVGGLDGTSLVGGEVVLSVLAELLLDPESLPPDVTFLAIPWAAPVALEQALAGPARDGRNAEPVDEDQDGLADEDGPDDVDGDGVLLEMLVPDPAGEWTRAEPGMVPVRAQAGDAPRYARVPEGRDDDGDGRFNEDGSGGVVIDLNFPLGRAARGAPTAGPLPLSDPFARALADLALARRVALAISFAGAHGGLATPGGSELAGGSYALPVREDLASFERAAEIFARALEREPASPLALRAARAGAREGAAIDWLYGIAGALAVEVAPWGPAVARGENAEPRDRGIADPIELERAWLRWIDNERGGLGFSPWRPVDLGDGRLGLLGGFEARTRTNPPEELLPRALYGHARFVRELAGALPALEIALVDPERSGDLLRLRARVRNRGLLPTGLWPTGRWQAGAEPSGAVLALELPPDATLLAGPERAELGRIAAGASAADQEWLVLAPAGAVLALVAEAPWCAPVRREIKR